jgi:tetratricopeptide (TPR) repeat protein
MHWILFEGDGLRARFEALAKGLQTNGSRAAVEALVGRSADEFSPAMFSHRSKAKPVELSFDDAGVRAALKVSAANPAEVSVALSDLLFSTGKTAEGAKELRRAAALGSDLPGVKEALAREELRDDRRDRAVELYRQAIAAGSKNPRAFLVSATDYLYGISGSGPDYPGRGNDTIEDALRDIRVAIKLNPGSDEAYRLLGRAFFLRREVTSDAIDEISKGVRPAGLGAYAQLYRALIYSRLGNTEACLADLDSLRMSPEVPDKVRALAQNQMTKEVVQRDAPRVGELIKNKRYDEAREIIAHGIERPLDTKATAVYQNLLSQVNESEAYEGVVRAFNDKDWEKVRELAKTFSNTYPQSRGIATVANMDRYAQRNLMRKKTE